MVDVNSASSRSSGPTSFALPAGFVLLIVSASALFQSNSAQQPTKVSGSVSSPLETHGGPTEPDLPIGNDFIPALPGVASYEMGLWDDPFKYRTEALDLITGDCSCSQSEGYGQLFHSWFEKDVNNQVLVLPVITPGGSKRNDRRDRMQIRHSVENALAVQGYNMLYPERMSYVPVKEMEVSAHDQPRIEFNSVVPIKVYQKENPQEGKSYKVVVLWVDDRCIEPSPLKVISQIVTKAIYCDDVSSRDKAKSKYRLSIVGPSNSDQLKTISKELGRFVDKPKKPKKQRYWNDKLGQDPIEKLFDGFDRIRIYSPMATVYSDQRGVWKPEDFYWPKKLSDKIELVRTIGNNETLVETLIEELDRRWLLNSNTVLFKETGFASPDSLLSKIQKKLLGKTYVVQFPKGVGEFGSDEKDSSLGDDNFQNVGDYFHRRMEAFKLDAQAGGPEPKQVGLVGILSNDTEDKLTIIRNARDIFPNATFFTFDLDWRFLDPNNLDFTRNLIVVTHYGLESDIIYPLIRQTNDQDTNVGQGTSIRTESISFRSGYSTSRFVATNLALRYFESDMDSKVLPLEDKFFGKERKRNGLALWKEAGGEFNSSDGEYETLEPQVFEIGSRSAINLTSWSEHSRAWRTLLMIVFAIGICIFPLYYTFLAFSGSLLDFHKTYLKYYFDWFADNFSRFIGIFSTSSSEPDTNSTTDSVQSDEAGVSRDSREQRPPRLNHAQVTERLDSTSERKRRYRAYVFLISILTILSVLLVVLAFSQEPLIFTAGISIWPAIFLFFAVIVLSTIYIWQNRSRMPWRLEKKFFDGEIVFEQTRRRGTHSNSNGETQDWDDFIEAVRICKLDTLETSDGFSRNSDKYYSALKWQRITRVSFAWVALLSVPVCAAYALDSLVVMAPGRGKLTIFLGTIMFYAAMALIFVCSAWALVQSLVLRRVLSLRGKSPHWPLEWAVTTRRGGNVIESPSNEKPNVVDFMWWVATSTRQSSLALIFPSVLLLIFAVALLPVFDGWPIKTAMFYFIIFPFTICICGILATRLTARKLRDDALEELKARRLAPILLEKDSEVMVFELDGGRSVAPRKVANSSLILLEGTSEFYAEGSRKIHTAWTKAQLREAIREIEGIDVGAFGNVWKDPILGTCVLLVTTLLTGQNAQLITEGIRLIGL